MHSYILKQLSGMFEPSISVHATLTILDKSRIQPIFDTDVDADADAQCEGCS